MYKNFARVYDALMAETPYDSWAEYIDELLLQRAFAKSKPDVAQPACLHENEKKLRICKANFLVLDLACGTGNIAIRLAKAGYDLIGADASGDMLAEASRKAENLQILFLAQDMRKLNLYGTIDAAVCVCDGLNYLLSEADLLATFKRVRLFLNPGGIFIFDMNTEAKFENMGNKIFEGDGGGEKYEWQNNYNPKTKINECRVIFFNDDSGNEPRNEPFEEIHRQRAFSAEIVQQLLTEAGFASAEIFDGYSKNAPAPDCERVVFVVFAKEATQ
ncbi:MAG: class I SAM-dependent methyltransferase [Defluviitaleaceae bacterium]|nr:class I SAM-dependent methyltransferase [Defluviitaleaceae bacterium]